MQPSTDVAPPEGEADGGALGQHAIAHIAVDLEDAGEARDVTDQLLGLAVGRVQVGDAGRVRSTLGPVVPCKAKSCPVFVVPPPGSSTVRSSRRRTASAMPSAARAAALSVPTPSTRRDWHARFAGVMHAPPSQSRRA